MGGVEKHARFGTARTVHFCTAPGRCSVQLHRYCELSKASADRLPLPAPDAHRGEGLPEKKCGPIWRTPGASTLTADLPLA